GMTTILLDSVLVHAIAIDDKTLYVTMTSPQNIVAAISKMGSSYTTLAEESNPWGLTRDGDTLFWTNLDAGTVRSMPTRSGTPLTIVDELAKPSNVATDGTTLFVGSFENSDLTRVALPDRAPSLFATDVGAVRGLIVRDGFVYWGDDGKPARILRAPVGGGAPEGLLGTGPEWPIDLAGDPSCG